MDVNDQNLVYEEAYRRCQKGDGAGCTDAAFAILGLRKTGRYHRLPLAFFEQFQESQTNPAKWSKLIADRRTQASRLFVQGCDLEDPEACYFAWDYTQPAEQRKSTPTLLQWQNNPLLRKATAAAYKRCMTQQEPENAHSCYQAGKWLLLLNDFERGAAAYTRAIKGLRTLCAGGNDSSACFILSQAEMSEPLRKEMGDKACKQGNSTACVTAGLLMAEQEEITRALEYFTLGCEQSTDGGHPGGCFNAARLIAMHNQQSDRPRVENFLRQACIRGDARACSLVTDGHLELLFKKPEASIRL